MRFYNKDCQHYYMARGSNTVATELCITERVLRRFCEVVEVLVNVNPHWLWKGAWLGIYLNSLGQIKMQYVLQSEKLTFIEFSHHIFTLHLLSTHRITFGTLSLLSFAKFLDSMSF